MAYPISAPTSYHGIAVTSASVTGLYQTATANASANGEAIALDSVGNPAIVEYYDIRSELTLDVLLPCGSPTLQITDTISLTGFKNSDFNGSYIVTGINETQTNTDFCKYSVTGKRFISNDFPDTTYACPSIP